MPNTTPPNGITVRGYPMSSYAKKKSEINPYEGLFYDIELYRFIPSNRFVCDILLRVPPHTKPETPTEAVLKIKALAKELGQKMESTAGWLNGQYEFKEPSVTDDAHTHDLININIISKKDDACPDHRKAFRKAVEIIKLVSQKTGLPASELLKHVQEHRPESSDEKDMISQNELSKELAKYIKRHPGR